MIAYTMVGVKNLERSEQFYTPIFRELGFQICWQDERSISYGIINDLEVPRYFIGYPFDKSDATMGNGVMTALRCRDIEQVKILFGLALEKGGSCEGPPGLRPEYGDGFYAAYVRDPDSNKLAFVIYR